MSMFSDESINNPDADTHVVRVTTETLAEDQRWGFLAAGYLDMGGHVRRIVAVGDDWIDIEVENP